MKPSELLRENGWCQHSMAISATGDEVDPKSRMAVTFCALGAIARCYSNDYSMFIENKLRKYLGSDIVDWNDADERTKEEVIAALAAIGE